MIQAFEENCRNPFGYGEQLPYYEGLKGISKNYLGNKWSFCPDYSTSQGVEMGGTDLWAHFTPIAHWKAPLPPQKIYEFVFID